MSPAATGLPREPSPAATGVPRDSSPAGGDREGPPPHAGGASAVCPRCARRSWLLAKLGVRLDFRARDLTRLWNLLGLGDEELIEAIGGRRRGELRAAYEGWAPDSTTPPAGVAHVCRHRSEYPRPLAESPVGPHGVYVLGGVERMRSLLDGAVVAVVGTARATDYGMETARGLARDLAACGVSVIGGLSEGVAHAAHRGALEAGGLTLTVMGGGVDRCSPACCGAVYRKLGAAGCVVSELPCGSPARPWAQLARARTLALLARLVIVVEATDSPRDLACAHLARALGRTVAAIPGRVSSRASSGTNLLIAEGAALLRGAQDTLDLLYGVGARTAVPWHEQIEPRLRATLQKVGEGRDTLAKLSADGASSGQAALALAELELAGLVVRGDAGRYVPCAGTPAR